MKQDTTPLIDILLKLCSAICRHKDCLKITPTETLKSITISVECHPADFVKLMGAKCKESGTPCKVFNGLKAIMQAAGKKIGKNVEFMITEPAQVVREQVVFTPNTNLTSRDFIDLFYDVCHLFLHKEFRINPVDVAQLTTFELFPDPSEGISEKLARGLDNVFYIYGNSLGRKVHVECDSTYCDEEEDLNVAEAVRLHQARNRNR